MWISMGDWELEQMQEAILEFILWDLFRNEADLGWLCCFSIFALSVTQSQVALASSPTQLLYWVTHPP